MSRLEVLTCAPEPASLRCSMCGQVVQTLYELDGCGRYICAKHLTADQRFFLMLMEREPSLRPLFEMPS